MRRFPVGPTLRHVEELYQPAVTSESALRLADAKVVIADYELIQADFPYLGDAALMRAQPLLESADPKSRARAIHAHIDEWLIQNAAVISSQQAQDNEVNTPIATTGERVTVSRPPRYGRALVVPAQTGGLLDVKGAGIQPGVTPSTRIHQSGLMFLGEALADLAYQRVMDHMFRAAETRFCTLPTYAILSSGFGVRVGEGAVLPAGMQIRRAHRRPLMGGDLPGGGSCRQRVKFEIEMLLRHFGMTSCGVGTTIKRVDEADGRFQYIYAGGPAGDHTPEELTAIREFIGPGYSNYEGVNIQLIRECAVEPSATQVVDFGHYEVRERFDVPVVSLVADRVLRWGGALRPDHEHFVQPRAELQLPLDEWQIMPRGSPGQGLPGAARHSPVDVLAYDLAARWSAGAIPRDELGARLEALIERATPWSKERA